MDKTNGVVKALNTNLEQFKSYIEGKMESLQFDQ